MIDNEDKSASRYKEKFGAQVLVFNKAAIAETFDEGDNFDDRRAVIYARNACFDLARGLGITYFMELDDDYKSFDYRFDDRFISTCVPIKNLDAVLARLLEFYKSINARSIAMMQGGDMLGGRNSANLTSVRAFRKCMNTFLCSTKRPFQFVGRVNEDVNTYTWYQSLGNLFLSINNLTISQNTTQHNPGGMTDLYLDSGTYIKSFYTVMYFPSGTKIRMQFNEHRRLHHGINWDVTAPRILSEQYRKSSRRAAELQLQTEAE